ncbi:hypothetical protein KFL_006380070 [Klebsormidium nitens]|uniref:Homologous recombination OB-fold protein OB-fold domain-containing protein n=1 Tax=Klebsormidium nitens TaxID=105231 RepID=A0A1Y1IIA3_KLENI|nr:hypothetical protein KFL_006380070 [Klebsormidium nitens]|eukprot:GAQ90433.1 hypothetical protein KFL_006380070 [Klebsormidium nitens]
MSAPAKGPPPSEGVLCHRPPVIPGPAGAVQRALAQGRSSAEAQGLKASTSKQAPLSLDALPDEDFSKGPWLAALDFIQREGARTGALQVTRLRELRKGATSKRIGHLVVMVKSMSPTGEGDMFAIVKDPSGTLEGTLHRKLLADAQLGPITTGTVLVLQQVALFRPVPRTCYLNIVSSNVLKIFPTKTPRPVSGGSLRASPDPALAEPSWGNFDLPTNSNSLKSLPRSRETASAAGEDLPRNATNVYNCETPQRDSSLRTSADFARMKIGDVAGLSTRLEDLLPELPSQRTGSASGAIGSDGNPDTPGPPSATPSELDNLPWGGGDQTARSSRPSVALPGATPRQNANRGTHPAAANGGVPAGVAMTRLNLSGNVALSVELPSGETVRTGPSQGSGPGQGVENSKRGREALSVDIQQLLAGLDEEDWFMPGEDALPPNKKSRELEESLPF